MREKIRKSAPLNRNTRRKLASRAGLKELIQSSPDLFDMNSVDVGDFPVPEGFVSKNVLRRCFMGDISLVEADAELTKWVTDPEELFKIWFKYYGKPNPLDFIQDCAGKFEKSILAYQLIVEEQQKLRNSVRQFKRTIRDLKKQVPHLKTKQLPPEMHSSPNPGEIIRQVISGLDSKDFNEQQKEVLAAFCMAFTNGRKFQPSDLVDLYHSFYLPYCDLWRSDRKFASLLVRARVRHFNKIVRTLPELVERINASKHEQ